MRLPSLIRKCLVPLVIVIGTLVASEVAFRVMIFSKAAAGKRYRNPALYFDHFTDDRFWEANYFFGMPYGNPGKHTHPLLGWSSARFSDTFEYRNEPPLAGRRPVLLYGDSFASCSQALPKCFEDYFNEDKRFSEKCYFINYAVGAHGVDQIYLTFKSSVDRYRNPIVVYSLMTMDLDRAVLKVFTKQKPYFILRGDQLVLSGLPIDTDVDHFFATHRPRVWSYLYLLFYRKWSGRNAFATDPAKRPLVQRLGRAILKQAIDDLKARHIEFMFVVFVPNWMGESYLRQPDAEDWRLTTILALLQDERVPYLVTKDLMKPILASREATIEELVLSDGHPSDEQNRIIFEGIRQRLAPCLP